MPQSIFWSLSSAPATDSVQADWWGLDIVTRPVDEPVTIDDVKRQARVYTSFDDSDIAGYMVAARRQIERRTNRSLLPTTWDFWLQQWPSGRIYLPRAPLMSVAYLNFTDTSETVTAVDPGIYDVNTTGDPGAVVLQYGRIWPPGPLSPSRPINARFQAGYQYYAGSATVSADGTTVTWVSTAQGGLPKFNPAWPAMERITLGGISYRILSVATDGSAITLATPVPAPVPSGAVAWTLNLVPEDLRLAIKMLASHWYDTGRSPIQVGRGLVSVEVGNTLDSLCDEYRVNPMGLYQISGQAA